MNIGGHVFVAATVRPQDPWFWLGAALPDLAAMGRFRLLGSTSVAAVSDGIAFHHRTDEVFHRHPWFTSRLKQLRADLSADGVGRGPARAVAHVGPELLLDGCLLGSDTTLLDAALAPVDQLWPQLGALVSEVDRDRFEHHLRQAAEVGAPGDHDQVDAVANRLYRILSRRPRLGFELGQVEIVERHLAAIQPGIEATGRGFADELVATLADHQA